MVTTKGTSLNPNAEVWQDIPTQQNTPAGTENSSWLQTYSSSEMTEGYTDDPSSSSKGYYSDYPDSTCDFIPVPPCSGHDMDQPGLGYLVFDSQGESVTDSEDCKEQAVTEESLRESLKKQLEFCFSRYFLYKSPLGPWWPLLGPSPLGVSKHLPVALRKENLSKDMYLISQMDNDQFVPIWTIACMEDIQALTTDVDLILDVLKASPLVEVDEAGEKVRPNHSRCIIILREVSETTPVEEVEALFRSENCPKMLSAEFAHNSNWYITFQSDMDALKAYRYLREEVKTFQGKPVMARIKAINTFFGKNGFPSMDSGGYQQHTQPQPQFAPPIYMQQVYNPQQQYPVYPVVSPTWNPPIIPQFETPLAPFPNNGFMNGYSSNGVYKATCSSVSGHRSTGRNRNHIKALPRSGDLTPSILAPVTAINGMSSSLDSQDVHASRTLPGSPPQLMSLSFDLKDTSISSRDLHRTGRERRSNHRGMRRKREEENNLKPVLTMEAPPPNFDLEASSFPPLPGCVATVQEETVTDVRLSDVVRGLKVSSKVGTQENDSTQNPKDSDNHSNKLDSGTLVIKPTPLKVQTETQQTSSTVPPVVKEDKTEPTNSKDVISPSTPTASTAASEQTPSTPVQAAPTENPALLAPASEQGQRKLSYAEVCQRPARDPPPALMPPSPSSPATSASQPLQELKVNTVEEPRPNSKKTSDRAGDKRPSRHPSRAFRGTPGQNRVRSSGMKIQEHQRGKRFSPQQGAKHSGKEQNIPPTSPQ